MKKIMMIGRVGSGKTTLKQRINDENVCYDKTQVIEFYDNIIDTPGEYLENRMYTKALITTANEADIVVLVEDATAKNEVVSYGFGNIFNKPIIGIITKIDLIDSKEKITEIEQRLFDAGASEVFQVGFNSEDQKEKFLKRLQGGIYEDKNFTGR